MICPCNRNRCYYDQIIALLMHAFLQRPEQCFIFICLWERVCWKANLDSIEMPQMLFSIISGLFFNFYCNYYSCYNLHFYVMNFLFWIFIHLVICLLNQCRCIDESIFICWMASFAFVSRLCIVESAGIRLVGNVTIACNQCRTRLSGFFAITRAGRFAGCWRSSDRLSFKI